MQYKQSFNQIQRLGNTTSDTNEILNSLIEDGALVIQNATILSDVSIDHNYIEIETLKRYKSLASRIQKAYAYVLYMTTFENPFKTTRK